MMAFPFPRNWPVLGWIAIPEGWRIRAEVPLEE